MRRWIPFAAGGAALMLSACTGPSPGPYEGGVEDLHTLMGPQGPAEAEL